MSGVRDDVGAANIAELGSANLRHGAPSGVLRQFRARLVDVEPRSTVQGVRWGVLCLAWSGLALRCPLFPTQWARSAELTPGDVYRVVGTVEFRDLRTVVRVLSIEESLRLLPSGHRATQHSGTVTVMTQTHVELLKAAIVNDLPQPMGRWPGGYPDEIEAALIDAVLSIRSTYGSTSSTGVRGAVGRYRDAVGGGTLNDLARLASFTEQQLVTILQNKQKTSGVLKAHAILQAAQNLTAAGAIRADQLSPRAHRRAYTQVRGLGGVTWEYFTMLLGHPGIKADTWITRWVTNAVHAERQLSSKQANALLKQAATELSRGGSEVTEISLTQLDHAIWRVARSGGLNA